MIKGKKTKHIYIYIYIYSNRVCYILLIFKFILIYLLHVLFILKIEGIFGRKKSQPKRAENGCFLYTSEKTGIHVPVFSLFLLR